jgi:hypothetical protein
MTNDERNPKPECRNALSCCDRWFRPSDFVIRHSDLRITSVQRERLVSGLVRGAREWVGSWIASFRFSAFIGTMNPPLTPPRRGTDTARTNARSPPGRGRGWVGSWKASFRFSACIGTMNLNNRDGIAKVLPASCRQCFSAIGLPTSYVFSVRPASCRHNGRFRS